MFRGGVGLSLALCWLWGVACSRPPAQHDAPPAPPSASAVSVRVSGSASGDCAQLFAPPPGADLLCDQHDLATDAEVHWRSFGLKNPRASVDARYREIAGRCGVQVAEQAAGLSITQGPMHLSTHDARPATFPSCERPATPEHQTVVLISSMFRR